LPIARERYYLDLAKKLNIKNILDIFVGAVLKPQILKVALPYIDPSSFVFFDIYSTDRELKIVAKKSIYIQRKIIKDHLYEPQYIYPNTNFSF